VVGRPSDRGRRQGPARFLPDRADAAPVAVEEKFEIAAEEVAGPVTYGLQIVATRTETVSSKALLGFNLSCVEGRTKLDNSGKLSAGGCRLQIHQAKQ